MNLTYTSATNSNNYQTNETIDELWSLGFLKILKMEILSHIQEFSISLNFFLLENGIFTHIKIQKVHWILKNSF